MVYELIDASAFLLAAFLLCLIALLYTLAIRRTDRLRNKVYVLMLVFTMICAVCEISKKLIRIAVTDMTVAVLLLDAIEYIHSAIHITLPLLLSYYIILMNGSYRQMGRMSRLLFFAPCVLAELLVMSNPLHQQVYKHDEELRFIGGWGMSFAYAVAVLYIIVGIVNLIRHRKAVSKRRLIAMLIFIPVVFAGMAIQIFASSIKCELFTIALMLLGVMLTLENEDERMDAVTGVYNRDFLKLYLRNLFRLEQSFDVIAVRLTNYDTLMRLSGKSGVDPVMKRVAAQLREEHPWYRIYRSGATSFILITDGGTDEAVRLSERIYVRFLEGLYIEDCETAIKAAILRGRVPDELFGVEDVLLMVDGPLPTEEDRGIVSGKRLSYLSRSTDLENALSRSLRSGGFSIWYQPVHTMEGLRPYALKALLRLNDAQLGDVMPDEFIPQAERTGLIHAVGDLVLDTVCAFIKSGVPAKLGYSHVNVNLSFVQCMQQDFAKHVRAIVKKYDVDPSCINFEITKPVSQEDFDVLSRVMGALKKEGFLFSMEDFGAGYANVESIFALDFDVVKIDRSILWEAMKSEMGRIVLTNSVRLIRQLERAILVEGVETQEQIDLLSDMEVDYLQGYFFSKPVPAKQLEKMALLEDM